MMSQRIIKIKHKASENGNSLPEPPVNVAYQTCQSFASDTTQFSLLLRDFYTLNIVWWTAVLFINLWYNVCLKIDHKVSTHMDPCQVPAQLQTNPQGRLLPRKSNRTIYKRWAGNKLYLQLLKKIKNFKSFVVLMSSSNRRLVITALYQVYSYENMGGWRQSNPEQ